jgi:hypothetical protein
MIFNASILKVKNMIIFRIAVMGELMRKVLVLMSVALLLAACGQSKPEPARAVEAYLQTFVDKDDARLVTLVCPDFEMDALIEYDSFGLVKTALEDLDCQQTALDGDTASVVCQGSLQATYGNEVQSYDLAERTYSVINPGDEWLVCGYSR